ncbi:hypothetical protein VMCG_08502 [Cytospora schulzeri]|uniref:Uncharacterized protein n=1 Tax=Cytospora schulzeri TaxID=448051 RepID=A0A423VWL2_9PEZI|nr:hypothetical protein VMCG_08502 [Valsa malicola]
MCLVEYNLDTCPRCHTQYRGPEYLPEGMQKCWENQQEGGRWEPTSCPWKLVQSSGIETTMDDPCDGCVETDRRVQAWCDEQASRKRKPGRGGGGGDGGGSGGAGSSAGGRSSKRIKRGG